MLYFIPQLALVAGLLVRVLVALVPHSVLRSLVSFYMGSPPDGAVDTTTAFIKSVRGVRQALYVLSPSPLSGISHRPQANCIVRS